MEGVKRGVLATSSVHPRRRNSESGNRLGRGEDVFLHEWANRRKEFQKGFRAAGCGVRSGSGEGT